MPPGSHSDRTKQNPVPVPGAGGPQVGCRTLDGRRHGPAPPWHGTARHGTARHGGRTGRGPGRDRGWCGSGILRNQTSSRNSSPVTGYSRQLFQPLVISQHQIQPPDPDTTAIPAAHNHPSRSRRKAAATQLHSLNNRDK